MPSNQIDISIIIPVLNESAVLPELWENLAGQLGVTIEVIACDGGSDDGSPELLQELGFRCPFTSRIVTSGRGRGRQMNAGAAAACGDLLLFLHADSRFDHPHALQTALAAYRPAAAASMAGRFRLSFRHQAPCSSLAYFYLESKARLGRPDCIRGDQGFLISRRFFLQLGGFDTSLPYLEDIRLAEEVEKHGGWLLLPAGISTSARRFETEGFYERQVLNAIITAAMASGWDELLHAMPGLYRSSCRSEHLMLHPLLDGIRGMIASHDGPWRRLFWRSTGRHVATNAWQIFFWLDVRRAFRDDANALEHHWYDIYNRLLRPLFESPPAALLAQVLTRLWFRWMLLTTRG